MCVVLTALLDWLDKPDFNELFQPPEDVWQEICRLIRGDGELTFAKTNPFNSRYSSVRFFHELMKDAVGKQDDEKLSDGEEIHAGYMGDLAFDAAERHNGEDPFHGK